MRNRIAVALAVVLAAPHEARAVDHVVLLADVDQSLEEAGRARTRDLAAIDALLSTPEADTAAAQLGLSIETVRRAVPGLNDAELHDLAARASVLTSDPASGSPIVPIIPAWVVVVTLIIVIGLIVGLGFGIKALVD